MRRALKLHPDCHAPDVRAIEVEFSRDRSGHVELSFMLHGRLDALRIPTAATPQRRDGLWQHTCFEAFVRAAPGAAYREFNLSPSGEWAAYCFRAYREGMITSELEPPGIDVKVEGEQLTLRAKLAPGGPPDQAPATIWRVGLSAVVEAKSGDKSFWALSHPPGKADFHHEDCFAIELPATERR